MAKMLLYRQEAREALGRGVAKFTRAIDGTIGPKGGNSIIDVPIGTPIVTRDGVQIATEIELDEPFENVGVQVVREASRQTNEVAGDGTTTAAILADAIIQSGLRCIGDGANSVDLVRGIEKAAEFAVSTIREQAVELPEGGALSVASVAAGDRELGQMVADALEQVGTSGILDVEAGESAQSTLEIASGFTFDRGYLSHHLATEVDTLEAVVPQARILLTDAKIRGGEQVSTILQTLGTDEALVIIADAFDADAISALIRARDQAAAPLLAVHPPEYGRWREAVMEDLATVTGARYICADMGRYIEDLASTDLGGVEEVRATEERTVIVGGAGGADAIAGRRERVVRQLQVMEQPVERDKLEERLAQLQSGGGRAVIYAGGYTNVEQRRRELLIEDAINATRHAMLEGVVPGGGMALVRASQEIEEQAQDSLPGDQIKGAGVLGEALLQPLRCITENCGADVDVIVPTAQRQAPGHGFDAERGGFGDLLELGVVDPVKVPCTALENAVSVAGLILTVQSLITDKPEMEDPTAGPARGGGGENLGLTRLGED